MNIEPKQSHSLILSCRRNFVIGFYAIRLLGAALSSSATIQMSAMVAAFYSQDSVAAVSVKLFWAFFAFNVIYLWNRKYVVYH